MSGVVLSEKLDKLIEEFEELKKLVRRPESEGYTAEEAFWKTLDDIKHGLHPAWLRGLDIPLEAFERFLVPYLVYEEDIHRAVKYFVKKGYVSVRKEKWEDVFKKEVELKVVFLSENILEEEPSKDTLLTLLWEFSSAYRSLFKQKLTKGTLVSTGDYRKVMTKVVYFKMHWYFDPFIKRKILYTKDDLEEWVLEIEDYALWNSLVHNGFAEQVDNEEGGILRFLVGERDIVEMLKGVKADV